MIDQSEADGSIRSLRRTSHTLYTGCIGELPCSSPTLPLPLSMFNWPGSSDGAGVSERISHSRWEKKTYSLLFFFPDPTTISPTVITPQHTLIHTPSQESLTRKEQHQNTDKPKTELSAASRFPLPVHPTKPVRVDRNSLCIVLSGVRADPSHSKHPVSYPHRTMCGVGFICHIKGHAEHKIVSDARNILCNMTHRGASECMFHRLRSDFTVSYWSVC